MQIVINRCQKGETLLSPAGLSEYVQRAFGGTSPEGFTEAAIARTDVILLALMNEDRAKYAGHCTHINIIELPDDFVWHIRKRGNVERIVPGAADA